MLADFDIAIIGSGFAGSLTALIARQLGHRVVLIERTRHPRFVIGESSTPLADQLWGELTARYQLRQLAPLGKWGTWQRAHPQLACGLKRGFTFLHHRAGREWTDTADRERQLLVAASSRDETADTHWYRPDFDAFLVREAQAQGVEYLDDTTLLAAAPGALSVMLNGQRRGQPIELRARFVVDASGPRGFLFRTLGLPEVAFAHQPATQALYSHFTGVRRLEELGVPPGAEAAPYPPDDAAVHHVFDGGWIWVLRFNNGLTSAGAAVTDRVANDLELSDREPAWQRLLDRFPTVRDQFAEARLAQPFLHSPRLPFRCGTMVGERWALLPYAGGFIDPLLSTGFPLTLLGIDRLANALAAGLDSPEFPRRLEAYARASRDELLAAERLIASLYATMRDAPSFNLVSLLYFAAAAYSEIARRLDRAPLAGGFLLHDHPVFGPRSRVVGNLALAAAGRSTYPPGLRQRLRRVVLDAIGPIDATGLSRVERRNWYPVEASDLIDAAPKFGLSEAEMARFTTA